MASTLSHLLYHIVFSTKDRAALIEPSLADDLYAYMGGILHNMRGAALQVGGMPDHVHILARLRPETSIAEAVRLIKANSSRWARERIRGFAWQEGYGAFTVSASQAEVVRSYIARQAEHHRTLTFREEYLAFLGRHGIEFDERYVWG